MKRLNDSVRDAIAAARAFALIDGPDAVDVGGALTGIATVHFEQARWKEAINEYEQALAIREVAYGPDHPEVAFARNNLANTLREDGRPSEAEPILHRALETLRASLEPDHPIVARVEANYGALLLELGRVDEGAAALERSFAALERKLGRDHPDMATAHNMLADADEAAGRFDVAAKRIERAVELLAANPVGAAMMKVDLGALFERAGRVDEARRTHAEALADLERIDADPIAIALARFAVARTMDPAKREDARALARRARDALATAGPQYASAVHEIDVWLR